MLNNAYIEFSQVLMTAVKAFNMTLTGIESCSLSIGLLRNKQVTVRKL